MRRKIIKQGHNTLTLTLPSEWAKRFNLHAGNEVEMFEKENGLFVTTDKNKEHKRAEITITGMEIPIIWKYFMAVYREGYDEVLVKFDPAMRIESPFKFLTQHKTDAKYRKDSSEKKSIIEVLPKFVSRFIGFEIVEHGKDSVLIKEMGDLTAKEFENSLRRVFLILQQMFEEMIEAIETEKPETLEHIHDIDINLDKFQDYCIRILNRVGNVELKKTHSLFAILFFLELIGDEFKNIAQHVLYDFKKQKLKELLPVAKSIQEQFNIYYSFFYTYDLAKIRQMSELDEQRYFSVNQVYHKTKEEGVKEIFHHLRVIAKHLNTLTELRVEMEF